MVVMTAMMETQKDEKEDNDRRSRRGRPGGDGGGGDDPGGNVGGNGGRPSDEDRLPIWAPREVPGISSTSCSERTRGKHEQHVFKLPSLPTSAALLRRTLLPACRADKVAAWCGLMRLRKPSTLEISSARPTSVGVLT
jgi:hypothetical protein